ncbi:MAG: hypothetical protein QMC90_03585 [Dehalococcoidales bacterium]|nr:hypothetical protein [Dehalococcoidales bacterium]
MKIVAILNGVREDEIASIMGVRPKYIAEICQSLIKDGYLIGSARSGGYALKREAANELWKLAKARRTVYGDEISERLLISPELASGLCQSLMKEGYLVRTPKGGYLLKKDLDMALKTIRDKKKVTSEEVAGELGISAKYAALLCQCLVQDCSVLKTAQGKYIPAEKDASRLLKLIKKVGCAHKAMIACKMRIAPGYTSLLCSSLVKDGYLRTSPDGEYYYPM